MWRAIRNKHAHVIERTQSGGCRGWLGHRIEGGESAGAVGGRGLEQKQGRSVWGGPGWGGGSESFANTHRQ
jgi:hypothetical protein